MRVGVIAESIIERLVLKSNAAPEPLLETQMAFSIARSIMAAVKLGLFEAASDGRRVGRGVGGHCVHVAVGAPFYGRTEPRAG